MGKKLTEEEIIMAIKAEPNTVTFDICSVCDGTEISHSMSLVNDENESFDLICDECLNEKK